MRHQCCSGGGFARSLQMGGDHLVTREFWLLGAGVPGLPFATSYQFIGQNERFQGA